MLPFERASQNSWLGYIFARNWRPYQKFTFLAGLPVAQNLSQSRFSCMLIPFSMDLLDSDEGIVKYSPLYGRGSKVTILVGRYFQSRILPFERASQKTWFGHIFVRIWRPNQKCNSGAIFWRYYPTPLKGRSMTLVPRDIEAQSLS